jgi:hypothetical protein
MAASKAGFILALIGGIIGIIMGLIITLGGSFFSGLAAIGGGTALPGTIFMLLGIYTIISSIVVIIGGVWMNNPEKCKKGAIVTLIFSVIGGGGLLGIIGGILGLVASGKADAPELKSKK